MFVCPRCAKAMNSRDGTAGRFLECPNCAGRACTVTVLRNLLEREEVNRVWRAAYEGAVPGTLGCPCCAQCMREIEVHVGSGTVRLDACRSCQLVWFDPEEMDRFRPLAPAASRPEEPSHSAEARKAMLEAERWRIIAEKSEGPAIEGPEEPWKLLPGVLGLPVKLDGAVHERPSVVTWSLTALVCLVSVAGWFRADLMELFAWIPSDPFRLGGATFLTVFFVHAGWLHLLGNLYFFVTFGTDVEQLLGGSRFVLLLLVALLGAAIGHGLVAPDFTIPCVGASGAISGILAFYAVRLPRARISFFVFLRYRFRWFTMSARVAFGIWVALQLLGAREQAMGISAVSAGAHLGGAGVGLLLGLFSRR